MGPRVTSLGSEDNERDARIAPTAYYTAYVWHRLGLPHAELFATPRGAMMFWSFRLSAEWLAWAVPGVPTMMQYLAVRHGLIEHSLKKLEPDRIVEIGSGLSRRGVTWAGDLGVDYLEIDLGHMIEEKRRRIERGVSPELAHRLAQRLCFASHDVLAPDFSSFLAKQLGGAQRPVVVAEGLLGYFEPAERARLARALGQALASAGGGSLLCDLRAREGGAPVAAAAAVLRGAIRLATRGRGARADFANIDAVRGFFREAGFVRAEPVDQEALPDLAQVPTPARVWHAEIDAQSGSR